MVKLIAGDDFGLSMADLNFSRLYGGVNYHATSKTFEITYASGFVDTFKGRGFKYNDDGEPTSGTVKSFSESFDGDAVFSVKGFHASAKAIGNAAGTGTLKDDYKIIQQALDGNDTLQGGALNDVLLGYDGDDKFIGGGGPDSMIGGKGADHFIYKAFTDSTPEDGAIDYIADFRRGQGDKIDLSAVAPGLEFGVNVGFLSDQGTTIVGIDMENDGQVELAIQFAGGINFKASDFIL